MALSRFHIQLLHARFAHCSGGPCRAYLTWTVLHSVVLKALSAFQAVRVSGCLQYALSLQPSKYLRFIVYSTPCLAMSAFSLPCKFPVAHVPACLLTGQTGVSPCRKLTLFCFTTSGGSDDAGPPARGCFRVSREDPVLGIRLLPCSNQKFPRCPDDTWGILCFCFSFFHVAALPCV